MTRQSRDQLQRHPTSRMADEADKLLRAKRDAPHRRAHSLPRRRWQPRIKISGKRQDAVEVLLKRGRGLRQWPSLLSARKHQQEAAPTSRNFRLLLRGVPCEPVVLSLSQLDTSAGPFPPPPQTLHQSASPCSLERRNHRLLCHCLPRRIPIAVGGDCS